MEIKQMARMDVVIGNPVEDKKRIMELVDYNLAYRPGRNSTKTFRVFYNEGDEALLYKRLLKKNETLEKKGGFIYDLELFKA
jgi:hypothetical protein